MTKTWRNWGRTETSQPATALSPRSIDQVVRAVNRARETGHSVKSIGASHSFTAIGATDGIRLNMDRLRGLVDADLEHARVTLWAGTHLWELPAILNPLGLALENMGDIDRQTISGATSTGTHGTGLKFGGLATQIVGATLVSGTGDLVTVSESENPELLPAVALGLGALGVLVTVTLQCVPRFLLHATESPSTFDDSVDTYLDRSESTDHYEFYWFPHTSTTRTKTQRRLAIDEPAHPLTPVSRFVDEELANNVAFGAVAGFQRVFPRTTPAMNRAISRVSSRRDYTDESHHVFVTRRRVRFRELEYALPLEAVPAALRELRSCIDRRDYRVTFPVEVRSAAADDLMLSTAYGRQTGYVAIHHYWRDPDQLYFRDAEAIFRSFDGRPHWGKMHTRDAESLRAALPKFGDFLSIRDQLDPDRVFSNDYLRRVLGN